MQVVYALPIDTFHSTWLPDLRVLGRGATTRSPWLAVANKHLELLHKHAAEVGLLPVSRSRVDVRPRGPKPWEFDTDPGQGTKFEGLLGRKPIADHYLKPRTR